MEQSKSSNEIYDAYFEAFPDADLFDSRAMSLHDFNRIEEMMRSALRRGSPMVEADLKYPVPEPEPELGLVF